MARKAIFTQIQVSGCTGTHEWREDARANRQGIWDSSQFSVAIEKAIPGNVACPLLT